MEFGTELERGSYSINATFSGNYKYSGDACGDDFSIKYASYTDFQHIMDSLQVINPVPSVGGSGGSSGASCVDDYLINEGIVDSVIVETPVTGENMEKPIIVSVPDEVIGTLEDETQTFLINPLTLEGMVVDEKCLDLSEIVIVDETDDVLGLAQNDDIVVTNIEETGISSDIILLGSAIGDEAVLTTCNVVSGKTLVNIQSSNIIVDNLVIGSSEVYMARESENGDTYVSSISFSFIW